MAPKWHFRFFASHLALFFEKMLTAVGGKEANQYHFATIPCSANRYDFVFMQSPTSDCMLPLADRKLYAEHKLMGGGVPSTEGLQLASSWLVGA